MFVEIINTDNETFFVNINHIVAIEKCSSWYRIVLDHSISEIDDTDFIINTLDIKSVVNKSS